MLCISNWVTPQSNENPVYNKTRTKARWPLKIRKTNQSLSLQSLLTHLTKCLPTIGNAMNCPTPAQAEQWDENLKEQLVKLPEAVILNCAHVCTIEL